MEYKKTSKRKKPNPKTIKTYRDILLSLMYLKETRLHEHGFVLMKMYKMC